MVSGSCVALVTPFKNGMLDEKSLRKLVDFHVANKTSAIVPCGSTGESATLTHQEHRKVIEIVIDHARKRIPVIAGTGSNSTQETIHLTRHAEQAGADAALVIVPYYNKPTQQGMVGHFSAVAKNSSLPLILYNIPSRTGANLLPPTLKLLAKKFNRIIGIKESSGNLEQVSQTVYALKDRKNFSLFSGDDSLTLPILSVGGRGVISVLANIAPRNVSQLCSSFQKGDLKKAQALHLKMLPLIHALFVETNPAPVKTAMEFLGFCSSELRLPMCAIQAENKKKLLLEIRKYGLR